MTAFAFLLLNVIFFLHYRVGPYMRLELNLETVSDMQAKVANTGAVRIDQVIGNILRNLKHQG